MFTVNRLFVRPIREDFNLDGFNCENGSITLKIKEGYYASLLKQAYAYEICIEDIVIGYYSLSIESFTYEDEYSVSPEATGYAAIRLNYLAIDKNYQYQGLGTKVLSYITQQVNKYSKVLPVRFLSLDALRDKVEWYSSRGFQFYDERELGGKSDTVAMYMDFCDIHQVKNYCKSLG